MQERRQDPSLRNIILSAAVTSVFTGMAGAILWFSTVNVTLARLEVQISSLQDVVQEMKSDAKSLPARILALEGRVDNADKDRLALREWLESLRDRHEALSRKVAK